MLCFNSFGQSADKPYPSFSAKDTLVDAASIRNSIEAIKTFESDDAQLLLKKINKSITGNPNNIIAYFVRGLFYRNVGKYDAAINDYSYILKNNISNKFRANALELRADAYYRKNEDSKAYTDAKKSIDLGNESKMLSEIIKDYEEKINDSNITQLEEETVLVCCPSCIKGKPTFMDYNICSNCKNWNSEYRRKVPCHVCKDTRKIPNGKCGLCNGKKNLKVTRSHYNQFKDDYVLFKKQTSK